MAGIIESPIAFKVCPKKRFATLPTSKAISINNKIRIILRVLLEERNESNYDNLDRKNL